MDTKTVSGGKNLRYGNGVFRNVERVSMLIVDIFLR